METVDFAQEKQPEKIGNPPVFSEQISLRQGAKEGAGGTHTFSLSAPFQELNGVNAVFFIRLRRRPRALPVDECVSGVCASREPRYHCFGGFRHWRITLRSLGVGGDYCGGPDY